MDAVDDVHAGIKEGEMEKKEEGKKLFAEKYRIYLLYRKKPFIKLIYCCRYDSLNCIPYYQK